MEGIEIDPGSSIVSSQNAFIGPEASILPSYPAFFELAYGIAICQLASPVYRSNIHNLRAGGMRQKDLIRCPILSFSGSFKPKYPIMGASRSPQGMP